ncbi:polyadenylate-binding protein (macronuclear) [Tetrahymena thermophila SB210]|uniref:Polyadenylate-binding protein n=1 Tax=Tetrahymena thermophila (strain SB210) TaxID=312017 RepID=I7M7F8_TETTS|nr:polyadenylate-binding protein [Tetrahymena thermophila SB210]EAR92921.1 polyadenylate-binding protein [Tetrahymena thermophila SB210]|eukprot:XP_001013166.1 polyadenylate-binding protein [Tetrahymena thermophila SB210]
MLQTATQNQSTLLVQLLHEGVTKELIFKEFKKFGTIKSLKHFPKNKSALVEFQSPEEAKNAKQSLNHNKLLNKEINIVNYQNKDELKQKKKYNLFIHNVPQDLETNTLHNFMSKYGEITSLMLKKNDENKNLGYGYVQFETEEAYNEILKEHELNGKISLPNSTISFNIQKFNDSNKNKANNIVILGLFENEIPADQKEAKTQSINAIFEKIKQELNVLHFNFYTEYNESKKNFWVKVDFQYDDDKQEEHIYKTVKEQVQKNFSYSGAQNKGPTINFKSNESSERNLFFLGVKIDIKEQDIADWIQKAIGVSVPTESIKIKKRTKPANADDQLKTNNVSVFFDSQADGQKLMIFCAKQSNKNSVDEIFDNRHKVTLYLKKNEQESVQKLTKKIGEFQQNSTMGSNKFQTDIQAPNPIHPYGYPIPMFMPQQIPFQNQQPKLINIPSMQHNKKIQNTPQPIEPKPQTLIAVPNKPAAPQNIFIQFEKATAEEKKNKIEQITNAISTQFSDFDKLQDESKRSILGQIIYYKISELDLDKNRKIMEYIPDVQNENQARAKIAEFKQQVPKITGMLIDTDVFEVADIVDIVKDEKELIERCSEAIDLIISQKK